MKKHIITLSKNFLVSHPKKGQPTNFAMHYLNKKKKHTIREGYEYWKAKIDEVNAGLAQLEVRQWRGKPYATTQITLDILLKGQIGIQKIDLKVFDDAGSALIKAFIDDKEVDDTTGLELIKNDGLEVQDFIDWFPKPIINGGIIHFTDLRY